MRNAIRFMTRLISTCRFDDRLAQITSYVVALLVLVLGMLKLCQLGLDQAQLFFGVLLVLCLTMLCIVVGTVAGPTNKAV
jgi:hypothetical protein